MPELVITVLLEKPGGIDLRNRPDRVIDRTCRNDARHTACGSATDHRNFYAVARYARLAPFQFPFVERLDEEIHDTRRIRTGRNCTCHTKAYIERLVLAHDNMD